MPAPVVAIQPTHPTTTAHPPPPDTLFLPRWQAGALHFRVLQPAGVPKEMKTMRYSGHPLPMFVASLNSHLYYLSASKSARASPDWLPLRPPHPFRPIHLPHSSPLRSDTLSARARATGCMQRSRARSLPVRNVSRAADGGFVSLNENFAALGMFNRGSL